MSKIDILMATYNGEKYINEQIDSIINQTYTDWNLIIRDDGSKDGTVAIIKEYIQKDSRITLLEDNLGNFGYSKNFEYLLKTSISEYFMFCDQDDVWLKDKVFNTYNEMKKQEKNNPLLPILIHSDSFVVDENLNIIKEWFIGKRGEKSKLNSVIFAGPVQGSSIMGNKKLREVACPFVAELPFDYYLGLVSELVGKRIFIKECLQNYRQHQNNVFGCISKTDNKKSNYHKISSFLFEGLQFPSRCDKDEIEKVFIKFNEKIDAKSKKIFKDYSFIIDKDKNKFIRIYKFFKNKFSLYRKKEYIQIVILIILGKI